MKAKAASILAAIFFLARCTSDQTPSVSSAPPISDTVIISYSQDIVPIIQTYCLGVNGQLCHVPNTNQGSVGDFTTYEGLKTEVDNGMIAARVFQSNGGMPPSYSNGPTSLIDSDLQKFELWVDQGAPNN